MVVVCVCVRGGGVCGVGVGVGVGGGGGCHVTSRKRADQLTGLEAYPYISVQWSGSSSSREEKVGRADTPSAPPRAAAVAAEGARRHRSEAMRGKYSAEAPCLRCPMQQAAVSRESAPCRRRGGPHGPKDRVDRCSAPGGRGDGGLPPTPRAAAKTASPLREEGPRRGEGPQPH